MKMTPNKPEDNQISADEAMHMNRHERRALGKLNGVKIMGSNQPYVKGKEKLYGLKTFTGIKK